MRSWSWIFRSTTWHACCSWPCSHDLWNFSQQNLSIKANCFPDLTWKRFGSLAWTKSSCLAHDTCLHHWRLIFSLATNLIFVTLMIGHQGWVVDRWFFVGGMIRCGLTFHIIACASCPCCVLTSFGHNNLRWQWTGKQWVQCSSDSEVMSKTTTSDLKTQIAWCPNFICVFLLGTSTYHCWSIPFYCFMFVDSSVARRADLFMMRVLMQRTLVMSHHRSVWGREKLAMHSVMLATCWFVGQLLRCGKLMPLHPSQFEGFFVVRGTCSHAALCLSQIHVRLLVYDGKRSCCSCSVTVGGIWSALPKNS